MKNKDWLQKARRLGKAAWRVLSRNLGLKLLSVIFALFLWSYVISSTPTITREKTLGNVAVTVSGQSVLSSRELSVLTDLNEIGDARVRVRVTQSLFGQVTEDNVRVELDLSNIRTSGKQSVKLRGSTTYGTVVQVSPEYLELEIEAQDQRYVPVNVQLTGVSSDYWCNISRTNPSQIAVTGPTSIVQTVSSARAVMDVSGRTASHSQVEQYTLLDAKDNEVNGQLSRSTKSVTVSVEIYPTRQIYIETNDVLTGQAAPGYHVASVEISPTALVVAGEQALLDSLTSLTLAPVDISERSQTFTTIAKVSALKGVRHLSSEEVSVTVVIEPDAADTTAPNEE